MVQKRPFDDGKVCELPSKHQRQLDYSQLVSSLEFVPSESVTLRKSLTSDEGNFRRSIYEADEKLANGITTQIPSFDKQEIETNDEDEDDRPRKPFDLPFYSEYYNFDRPVRIVHSECPSRKLIPIGPEFQAVIPEYRPHAIKNTSNCSDTSETSDLIANDNDENKFSGICIIPISDLVPSGYDDNKAGGGGTHCCCQHAGSVRCVRQHIVEARDTLKRSLGQKKLEELGFSDMGEVVAEKWSDEEEDLFHEVVYSNSVSAGKNFWDHLQMVFPFRTKRDIVSYYFNVFMLRKRAEQNRFDSLNIDSDNDEWQGSEDSGDDEVGTVEQDEDSVTESPEYHDGHAHTEINGDYYEWRGSEDSGDDGVGTVEEDEDSVTESPEYHDGHAQNEINGGFHQNMGSGNVLQNYSSDPTLELSGKILSDESGDRDVQDDSCTSSDTGLSINRVSGEGGHEYVLEHCDTKVWDVGYLSIPKNEDFLPTCSMIEEVFGVGSWNCKASDNNDLS